MMQHWRDLDHLMRYASAREHEHLPAWDAFNRRDRNTHGVGIWHEAYEVQPDTSHILYRHMPLFGMGKATAAKHVEPLVPQAVTSLSSPPGNGGHIATVQAACDDLAVR